MVKTNNQRDKSKVGTLSKCYSQHSMKSVLPWYQNQRHHETRKLKISLMNIDTKILKKTLVNLVAYEKHYTPWSSGVNPRNDSYFNIWKPINGMYHNNE